MKIFVDTNIFLDIALQRENLNEALMIFKSVKSGIFEGVIADITIVNIDYISRKTEGDVRAYLQAIEKSFSIVGANNAIVKASLALENKDLEDNIQYLLAKELSCDCIVSNDKSFYKEEIEVLNSDEFIEKFLS